NFLPSTKKVAPRPSPASADCRNVGGKRWCAMMSNLTQEPLAVNDREVARLLGLSRSTVRSLVKAGQIRAVRAGRRLLIPLKRMCNNPAVLTYDLRHHTPPPHFHRA